jgi:two-component system response regulator YesN
MYSLVIVDDEQDVRRAVVSTIDWGSLGFCVAAEAENGVEALELVHQINPDVLITDIKMPYLNGLELIKAVRETNPAMKILMLTGYGEFEYAKSAIKYNIVEYMLKPITAQSLTETLQSLRKKMDEEREEISNIEKLKKGYRESLPVIREGFLVSLVTCSQPASQLKLQIANLDLKLGNSEGYLVITVDLDREQLVCSRLGAGDFGMVLESVLNLVGKIADKYLPAECFRCSDKVTAILSGSKHDLERYAPILMREISQSAKKSLDVDVTIGASGRFEDIALASRAYRDSLSALNYRLAAGEDGIICIEDLEPGLSVYRLPETMTTELDALLKTGCASEIERFVNFIFDTLSKEKISPADYMLCFFEIASVAVRASRVLDDPAEEALSLSLIGELYSNKSVDEMKRKLKSACLRLNEKITQNRQKNASVLVSQALAYIQANYANSGISAKSISQHLHISPNYLSSLIRKATGGSLIDALISVRMDKAREYVHYFSYCFKKYFGVSPNEMRLNLGSAQQ